MRHYVYQHLNLETRKVVYVGHGSGGRAWQCGSSHSPLRSKEHCDWADDLLDKGYTPNQWVVLLKSGMTKDDAKSLELELIHELRPVFNRSIRYAGLKFLPDLYDKAITLRKDGLSYEAIGRILGLSTMTVHRGIAGKSISLEIMLDER